MTKDEYKEIAYAIISAEHEADTPNRLPEERFRCYWSGYGEAIAMVLSTIVCYVEKG